MKRRQLRSRFRGTAGFYNFDALLASFGLFIVSVVIINIGSHWGLKWLEWVGMSALVVAIGLYLYLVFFRK